MDSRSFLVPAVSAALALSVGLNVYQAMHAPDVADLPPHPSPAASVAASGSDTCRADLEHCRQENWSVALRAMNAGHPPDAGAAPPASHAQAAPGPAAKTGAVEQDEALTAMAREQVRLQWKMSRGAMVPYLLHELQDPTRQEAWARLETQAMVDSANLTATQREKLERGYEPVRAANTAALKEALGQQPPDAAAAVAATKALYASEDGLMASTAGAEARDKWRAEALNRRTALIAVLAALGDQPWDKSLAW